MEEEMLKAQAGWETPQGDGKNPATSFAQKLSGISFVPESIARGTETSPEKHARYALIGVVFGALSLVSFFVIALSIVFASFGALFSLLGIHSSRGRIARAGVTLSLVGGLAAIIYMVAVYMGVINYNYFTNELWGIPAGGVQVLE